MAHVNLVDPASSTAAVKPTLDKINGAFGVVPNMFKAVANSPAALASMWGSFGALGGGKLGARLGEEIAVAVANANNCEYCLAAHTALGRKAGSSSDEMAAAQVGNSSDPRTQAALTFALKLVRDRAAVTDVDVAALKAAGFDDEGVVEIIAHVALNLFTNYVNVALNVPVDFPAVQLKRVA
ncbi:peroxidase-related enzyme [Ochrobactrum vermis]|uniref:Peroxidase-related enzyme n=1 Tax=Ochrobactrum vermis TaxID=1827297 RepID=A0ABU8PL71_9HYPH|nr:peroxidase-related enzyme [Ochrobactrum vermis]PQZ24369.1 carboxymuconolactone decarboxylase [Ochrobactrum vermis]